MPQFMLFTIYFNQKPSVILTFKTGFPGWDQDTNARFYYCI